MLLSLAFIRQLPSDRVRVNSIVPKRWVPSPQPHVLLSLRAVWTRSPLTSLRLPCAHCTRHRVSKRRMGGAAARPIAAETVGTAVEADGADSKVPGTEKIYVRTWG